MCGIAGFVTLEHRRIEDAQRVGAMMDALARRGPDSHGLESWEHATLGHRRLSIFDLSEAGHQPMLSQDGSVGVVFNGAIYNFRDLRHELEARGYQFKSNTDTEVLIHGYDAWSLDTLVSKLRGMFAFALWDENYQRLFLVRDRLGVKPLAYVANNTQLAFASNVRALRRGGFVDEIDEQAIAEYLEFGFVTDQRTIYRNSRKVPAATIVEWSRGDLSERVYWEPPEASDSTSLLWDEVVEEAERLFLAAVERRLFADVPVGALLSGGIDSSLICWAIAKLGAEVSAYTIGTPGDPWDESSEARRTAMELGIPHHVLNMGSGGDDPDALEQMVAAYAEPFACASSLGMLRISRAVASQATVLLTGDGGDDVFLGYPEHKHFWMAQKMARLMPSFAPTVWESTKTLLPRFKALRRAESFLDYSTGGLPAVVSHHDGLPFYEKTGMLGERLTDRAMINQRRWPWSIASGRNLLKEFLTHDRRMRFVGEYMTKVDGATMYYSLEARSPFLDQALWEFGAQLPFDVRLRGGRLKAVLREIAERRLGGRVARARKRGFGIPVHRWLAGPWSSSFEQLISDGFLKEGGWIKIESVVAELRKARHRGWAKKQLWYLFVLEMWLRHENLTSAGEASLRQQLTHSDVSPEPA